jgi:hypothetical protein
MNSFREIIDAFGVARLATLLGVGQSHVRVMKVRNVIPPTYWRKILDAPKPQGLESLSLVMLDDLYGVQKADEPRTASEAVE